MNKTAQEIFDDYERQFHSYSPTNTADEMFVEQIKHHGELLESMTKDFEANGVAHEESNDYVEKFMELLKR